MLTPDQVAELKSQLSQQIKHLPEHEKLSAQEQINNLSPEALEIMISQQKQGQSASSNKSPLRMIIDGEIPAKKIEENAYALAVLEIKPVSKGHIIIIPKEKVSEKETLPSQVFSLGKKISKRIITKLKAKNVEMQTETKFGEQLLDIIPCYEKPLSITSPRYEAQSKELEEVQSLLKTSERKKRLQGIKAKKTPSESSSSVIKLKRRIP